jgi:hypothetical protein
MFPARPCWLRVPAILMLFGILALGSARPATAGQELHFRKEFTLSEACLMDFDAFGAFWFFDRGRVLLDVDAWIGDERQCFVSVAGSAGGSGLNYKLGTSASLSALLFDVAECYLDPVDGVLRAKVRFDLDLSGGGGGSLPSEMRLAITPSGLSISGVTLGIDDEE